MPKSPSGTRPSRRPRARAGVPSNGAVSPATENLLASPDAQDERVAAEPVAAARLSEGAGTIGTLFRSIGHLMGYRVLSTFEVTEYEPNKRYGFKSLSGPLNSQTSYAFEIANGNCSLCCKRSRHDLSEC